MTSETATESGAITGMILSLVFLLWIAYGQPRPVPPKLVLSKHGCDVNTIKNITLNALEGSMKLSPQ